MTGIAPWLSVPNAGQALDFYLAAFGAMERERLEDDGQVVVAQLSIGGANFWIQTDPDTNPSTVEGNSVRMIISVDDPQVVFDRAVAAGTTEVNPVSDGYGWRIGRLVDLAGQHWEMGRRLLNGVEPA